MFSLWKMCPLLNIWERWPSKGINILPKINTVLKECACVLSCVQLCNSVDCRLPGSSVHEIIPEKTLEWVAISFSSGSSWCRYRTRISCPGKRILYCWATWEAPMSQRTLRLAVSSSSQRKRQGRNPSNNPAPLSLPTLPVARGPVLICSAVTPWTAAPQAPLSMGFSRQEYWSVAMPSSRGSSQPRDRTQIFHIAGGVFTSWATRETWSCVQGQPKAPLPAKSDSHPLK